ncbi:chorismate binding enzyme/Glutamine amidotransferase class-I [Corynebacterium mustelae]|uniref:anthranilate synthase n=1 Tax=Corynebacterium mustelae TaxID=571915 RepID=A0A0G3H1C9_9CORY|nr:chorismate-binding protein [Corynebacterium mustelae]AKK07199.1 chorismate binding enzyme/Glutamine amidotransferase class-I [Corynebacterium mustelae]
MVYSPGLTILNRAWKKCTDSGKPFFLKIAREDPSRVYIYEGEKVICLDSILEINQCCQESDLQCFMFPYSAIAERDSIVVQDDLKPMMFNVTQHQVLSIDETDREQALLFAKNANAEVTILPNNSDEEQKEMFNYAQEVLIETGEGCNFVFRRDYHVAFPKNILADQAAWACFLGVLSSKSVGYWNYVWFDGMNFVVGASPESLITLCNGEAKMTPISGTYKGEADSRTVEQFLLDEKEIYELNMVLDEELKIMAKLCKDWISVDGPQIIQSGNILHTGYSINGKLTSSLGEALLEALGAPTVVGSPARSAEKHIASIERSSRGFYAGACGVIQRSPGGAHEVESALVIRSMELGVGDSVGKISAGATIVRDSEPALEVEEVDVKAYAVAKMMGLTLGIPDSPCAQKKSFDRIDWLVESNKIRQIIDRRAQQIPAVWRGMNRNKYSASEANEKVLLIECGDNFIWMIAHILQGEGYEVTVIKWDCAMVDLKDFNCVVLGPGPGDPRVEDRRAKAILNWAQLAKEKNVAICAVCLSHQILAKADGYQIARVPGRSAQGRRSEFDVGGGKTQKFAAYNSFEVIDYKTMRTLNYRKTQGFRSFQWHPESVLSEDGANFLRREVSSLINEKRQTK